MRMVVSSIKKNRQGSVEEEKMCEREGDHMSYTLFTKLYGIKMGEYKERAHMYTKGLFNNHAVNGEQMYE